MVRTVPRSVLGRFIRAAFVAGCAMGCAVTMTVTTTGPCRADTADDQQRVDRELARAQAELESLTERARLAVLEYNQANAALPAAQATLDQARGRVLGARAESGQAKREADAAKRTAAEAEREFAASAAEVDQARREVSAFVAATFRGNGFAAINAVIDSGSPSDLATSIGYLDCVARERRRALDQLTAARMRAKQRSDVADAARRRAEEFAARAEAAVRAALAIQTAAEAAAVTVRELADQKLRASSTAEAERQAVLLRYEEVKAESERVAAELRAAAARGHPIAAFGAGGGAGGADGRLGMPVSGWISSSFGMRFDPYYQVWQLHAGMDFGASAGSPIVAAAAGEVVRASWNGGYGNYTCLYHGVRSGLGLSTCYAHQSVILVAPGQWVRQGQLIGRVGTTGASTGNHLHFEVRLDGGPVNPLGWLG